MSLNYNIGNIENWRDTCYERHTGPADELERMVERMSFFGSDWTYTDESKTAVERMSPKTNVIVFSTMSVGMGSITSKNWREFFLRLDIIQRESGYALLIDGKGEPIYLTPDDVFAHVGLTTNVANETNAKWFSRYVKNRIRDTKLSDKKEAA
jgi:hypothetical protein